MRGRGSIVNISSVSAKRPLLERTSYCMKPRRGHRHDPAMALEFGKWGRAGQCRLPRSRGRAAATAILEHAATAQGKTFEEVAAGQAGQFPAQHLRAPGAGGQRGGLPVSEEASMRTGQDINVSAGAWMS
jgi:hypothetical protein